MPRSEVTTRIATRLVSVRSWVMGCSKREYVPSAATAWLRA